MLITITSIRLKNIWKFFPLSYQALQITKQLYKQKGMLKFKKTGIGLLHFTLTAWENEADMKAFAYSSGAHKDSFSKTAEIASELRTYTYQSDEIPDWKTAKKLLFEKGKVLKY